MLYITRKMYLLYRKEYTGLYNAFLHLNILLDTPLNIRNYYSLLHLPNPNYNHISHKASSA